MMQYQRKDDPKTKVQAVQYHGDNAGKIKEFCPFCEEYDHPDRSEPRLIVENQGIEFDDYAVFPGSWLVKLGPAKYEVYRDDQFMALYQFDTTNMAIERMKRGIRNLDLAQKDLDFVYRFKLADKDCEALMRYFFSMSEALIKALKEIENKLNEENKNETDNI